MCKMGQKPGGGRKGAGSKGGYRREDGAWWRKGAREQCLATCTLRGSLVGPRGEQRGVTNSETLCKDIKCCEEERKHRDHCVWAWRGCLEKVLHRTRWTEAMQRTNSSILEGRAGSGKAGNDQRGRDVYRCSSSYAPLYPIGTHVREILLRAWQHLTPDESVHWLVPPS